MMEYCETASVFKCSECGHVEIYWDGELPDEECSQCAKQKEDTLSAPTQRSAMYPSWVKTTPVP